MNTRRNRPCQGTTKADEPCAASATTGSLYCFLHDPERDAERREWSRRGGKASSTQRRLSRLIRNADELSTNDLKRLLSGAMLLMVEGKLEPGQLTSLASAARTLDTIRTTADFQERLDAVGAALARAEQRRAIG